jgi:hypothetical protein
VTGFLVKDEDEMIAAVEKAATIDPRRCRQSAERFAPDRVAQAYEVVYFDAIHRRRERRFARGVAAPA